MNQEKLIQSTVRFVQEKLAKAEGGHDWWHIERVWNLSKHIAEHEEDVDLLIVELGALLHDIADSKFHAGDETLGPEIATRFLESHDVDGTIIAGVVNIIKHISFKGGNNDQEFYSSELGVVQDADRLDALGAIGIARAFNYGGYKHRALYDPEIPPKMNMTKEEYKNSTAPTINHFYEKLLLLKDRMNTETGKKLALQRHAFMETYLKEFYQEWEGKA